jgi:DNA-directed RNA polymerase specialized sigma24 family protein
MDSPNPSESEFLALIERSCTGDEQAWQGLWARLEGPLSGMIRQFHMGRVSHEEDERRAVVLEVMARLRDDDFRRLKMFVVAKGSDPLLALLPWIKVVARRVAIDHLRAHPNYVAGTRGGAGGRGPGRWKDPATLPPASLLPGARPAVTREGTAREMLAHARAVLPEPQYRALELKLLGEEPEGIAKALGLDTAAQAERLVRAALERLRRKFRTSNPADLR